MNSMAVDFMAALVAVLLFLLFCFYGAAETICTDFLALKANYEATVTQAQTLAAQIGFFEQRLKEAKKKEQSMKQALLTMHTNADMEAVRKLVHDLTDRLSLVRQDLHKELNQSRERDTKATDEVLDLQLDWRHCTKNETPWQPSSR